MIAAVKALPQDILDRIEYREWSLRSREGVARFRELGARSLPALAINGAMTFQAEIPPTEEIIAAIEASDGHRGNIGQDTG
jgi:hypothetical protein